MKIERIMPQAENLCPCHSGKPYAECCKPFHEGSLFPENALLLMRSRYAAYALGLWKYIIETTDPESAHFLRDRQQWKQEIMHFSKQTDFIDLEIIEFHPGSETAFVTFLARLQQGGQDVSFTEKSRFRKHGKQWLYQDGVLTKAVGN